MTQTVVRPEARDVGTPPPPEHQRALVQLVIVVAGVVVLALAAHAGAILIVVGALIAMVMLHELGHLLTAKWGHMKVTEYFLGFGPRLWSVRRGETEYGIKAIPAGGYVKILGMTSAEEVDPADEPRTYRQRPFHNRLAVGLAGSAMHFVMAFVILFALYAFIGAPQGNEVSVSAFSSLAHNADPARVAGLKPGDVFVAVNGTRVRSPEDLQNQVSHHAGRPITVVVTRDGAQRTIVVTPQADPAVKGANGRIGVILSPPVATTGPISSLDHATRDLGDAITGSVTGLGQVFSASGISSYVHQLTNSHAASQASHNGTPRLQSIYGAARLAVEGANAGSYYLVRVLVLIIVFVGVLNLFPMLPLDGGHVAIAVYERIRSRRGRAYHADVTKLTPVAYAFVLLLGFIVLSSLYLDIAHPLKNPFQ
ncbi:MAG TPA: site-2 protease family protein [Acidimicrobiales bacterium]|nr:site-2 protease family protein [Acidimicrobiales bacterium]